jgi:hypothetical protein
VVGALVRDVYRVDRSRIAMLPAARGALGVLVPLTIGVATSQTLAGVVICTGVLNVAVSDQSGPYRERVERLLVAAMAAAVSVFLGAATGGNDLVAVGLVAVWGFAGGLSAALGPAATVIGVPSIALLVVFEAMPQTLGQAAVEGGLVLLGGLSYAALAVAAWPVQPFGPQRSALAATFRSLASLTRATSSPIGPPAATTEMTTAGAALATMPGDEEEAERLRIVFDQAERIRLELLALDTLRSDLQIDASACTSIDTLLEAAGDVLDAFARTATPRAVADTSVALRRVEVAANDLRRVAANNTQAAVTLQHAEALAGQLRTVAELFSAGNTTSRAALAGLAG